MVRRSADKAAKVKRDRIVDREVCEAVPHTVDEDAVVKPLRHGRENTFVSDP